MSYYGKAISAWCIAIVCGLGIYVFAPVNLKPLWLETTMLVFLAVYYLVPPVLVTGIRDLEKAKKEHPFAYYWEIVGVTGLVIFLLVRAIMKLAAV